MVKHSDFEFLKIDDKTLKKFFDIFIGSLKEDVILDKFLKIINDAKNLYIPKGYSKYFYNIVNSRGRASDILDLEDLVRIEYNKSNSKDWIKVFTGISNLLKKGNVKSTSLNTYFIESLLKNIYIKLLGEKFDKNKFDNKFDKFKSNYKGVFNLNNKLSEFFGNYKPLIDSIKLNINNVKSNSSECDDVNKIKNDQKNSLDLKLVIHDNKGIKCKNIENEDKVGIINALKSNYFSNSIKDIGVLDESKCDKKELVEKKVIEKEDHLKNNLIPSLIFSEKINNNIEDKNSANDSKLNEDVFSEHYSVSDESSEDEENKDFFFFNVR